MNRILAFSAAAAASFAAAPALAQEEVRVPAFRQVELVGGGQVTLRHGPRQSVRLLRGSQQVSAFEVDRDGRLRIRACRTSCRNYDLRVEIVTPRIDALAIRGGGSIDAQGSFPGQGSLAAAVTGGGDIDARGLEARDVAAAVTGGGVIRTDPGRTLAASVSGGGSIRYWGNPAVTQSVRGGGSVERAGR